MRGAALSAALATMAVHVTGTCEKAGSRCLCTDTDGDVWDLTKLADQQTVRGPGSSLWDYDYNFAFCENIPVPEGPNLTPAAAATSAFRIEDYTPATSASLHNMGPDLNAGELTVSKLNGDAEAGVSIGFATVSYQLTVEISCDRSLRGDTTAPAAPTSFASAMTLTWASFESCPEAPGHPFNSGGLSFGSILLIVSTVGIVGYVGGGYIYNSQKHGMSGTDALPHPDFWANVKENGPRLVEDGVYFSRMELSTRFEFLSFLAPVPKEADGEDPFLDSLQNEEALSAPASSKKDKKKKKKKQRSSSKQSSSATIATVADRAAELEKRAAAE